MTNTDILLLIKKIQLREHKMDEIPFEKNELVMNPSRQNSKMKTDRFKPVQIMEDSP